jgi:hypothetical protein
LISAQPSFNGIESHRVVEMTEGFLDFGLVKKMYPMARRATASMEAMQQAIAHNNLDDVAKHIEEAKNALSVLERDLNLAKSFATTAAIAKSEEANTQGEGLPMGNISRHNNTVSDYDGTEGAVVLGVSRMGRSSTVWRPQNE